MNTNAAYLLARAAPVDVEVGGNVAPKLADGAATTTPLRRDDDDDAEPLPLPLPRSAVCLLGWSAAVNTALFIVALIVLSRTRYI